MKLVELVETIKDMVDFGVDKTNIDEDGYVTLYHGTVNPVYKLKRGEIFFMTPNKDEARDYANMRSKETGKRGVVMTIRVKPVDVNWNKGSYEVEFTKGGIIENGILKPYTRKKRAIINKKNKTEYKGVKVGDILPKTGWTVLDIVIHDNSNAQFNIKNDKGNMWYDANMVVNYEFSK